MVDRINPEAAPGALIDLLQIGNLLEMIEDPLKSNMSEGDLKKSAESLMAKYDFTPTHSDLAENLKLLRQKIEEEKQ